MPEFLSDAWLDALDVAARTIDPVAGIAPFVIEQVVAGDGHRDVRYRLVFGEDGLRVVRPGPEADAGAGAADIVFTTDRVTATAIARGESNAQRALAAGRFRIGGDVDSLVARAGAFSALRDLFGAVRAGTTFGERGNRVRT